MCETTTIETLNKIETETCSRCGGSGNYSYCQSYGTTCFKCRGRKVTMTKRGFEANRFLEQLRSRPASEIKVGDVVKCGGVTMGGACYDFWMRVDSIEARKQEGSSLQKVGDVYEMVPYCLDVLNISGVNVKTGKDSGGMQVGLDSMIRLQHTGEAATTTWAAAMAYQATLGKNGKPRKSRG